MWTIRGAVIAICLPSRRFFGKMPTVEEFREALPGAVPSEIIDRFLLTPGAQHVNDENIDYIRSVIAAAFGIDRDGVEVLITGSAKLGFALTEKRRREKKSLPRYRLFSALSDIDVAVISPQIFNLLWEELSGHAHRAAWFPPEARRLGDYLVCGWLRPDHFPRGVRLPRCDTWSDAFRRLSVNTRFERRSVNGGLFASMSHLRQYMARAVRECIAEEGTA